MRRLVFVAVLATVVLGAGLASAAPINVALNKPVTLDGAFGVLRPASGWPDATTYPVAAASTLTDGVFRAEGIEWQNGSVWWDVQATSAAPNAASATVNLLGFFTIVGFKVQADDNDEYVLEYHDSLNQWVTAWTIPTKPSYGLVTRPDLNQIYYLGAPIVTDGLRVHGQSGDGYYAVSEIQAFADPVPEPASLLLLGTGLAGLVRRRKRR